MFTFTNYEEMAPSVTKVKVSSLEDPGQSLPHSTGMTYILTSVGEPHGLASQTDSSLFGFPISPYPGSSETVQYRKGGKELQLSQTCPKLSFKSC